MRACAGAKVAGPSPPLLHASTRILGRRTAPFPPLLIPYSVPHGVTQDPSTDLPLRQRRWPVPPYFLRLLRISYQDYHTLCSIELRQALFSYQDYRMLLLTPRRPRYRRHGANRPLLKRRGGAITGHLRRLELHGSLADLGRRDALLWGHEWGQANTGKLHDGGDSATLDPERAVHNSVAAFPSKIYLL